MKQSKQPGARPVQEGRPFDGTDAGRRPLKPPAGRQDHHRFPPPGAMSQDRPSRAPPWKPPPTNPAGAVAGCRKLRLPVSEESGRLSAAQGHHQGAEHPPQTPRASSDTGQRAEQYVRLRVRISGDSLTVLDSHLVDSPLGAPTTLVGGAAYEVTVGERLVHADAVPDLGLERRSFANPDGPPEQHGHNISQRPTSEFAVRIPAHEVTAETLGTIRLRLHRVLGQGSGVRLGAEPLAAQLHERVEATAELTGLPGSVLPEAIEARGGRTGRGA